MSYVDIHDRIDLILDEIINMDAEERQETMITLNNTFCIECGWRYNQYGFCLCSPEMMDDDDEPE